MMTDTDTFKNVSSLKLLIITSFAALGLALIAYWPITGFFFQLEDWGAFQRLSVKEPGILNFWNPELENYFRPIEWMYYNLSYAGFGFNSQPYYLVSILHQTLNAVLVFVLVRNLHRDRLLAVLAAIIFAVYPTVWEAVSWIVAAGHLFLVTNMLLALIFAARFFQDRSPLSYAGMFMFYVLCLCTREQSVMVFPTIMLVHAYFLQRPINLRRELIPYIPLAPLFIAYSLFQLSLQESNKMVSAGKYGFGLESISNWFNITLNIFIPSKLAKTILAPDVVLWVKSHWLAFSISGLLITLAVAGGLLSVRHTRAGIHKIISNRFTYLAAIFIPLHFLVYSLFSGSPNAASRYTYIASVGASMLLAFIFYSFYKSVASKAAKTIVGILMCLSLVASVANIRLGVETFNQRTIAEEQAYIAFEKFIRRDNSSATYHFANPPYVDYAWERAISVRYNIPMDRLSSNAMESDKAYDVALRFDESTRTFRLCSVTKGSAQVACFPPGLHDQ